jgi:predicted  nucleic acid-binding Zn-ribbon protein
MQSELASLLNLQSKHKAVMDVEAELRSLEPELADLDTALAEAETDLAARRAGVAEADERRQELEGKIEGYRIMQERRRQRLEWVKGAKEASTLMAELDLARSVLAREEAEWIRSADKVQELERLAAEAEVRVQEVRDEQAPRREEIAGQQGELRDQLAGVEKVRDEAAGQVAAPLRERFERILRGRAPLALYPLQNGACGHCFTTVPLHRQQKIRAGTSIEACEACGVMVYAEPDA